MSSKKSVSFLILWGRVVRYAFQNMMRNGGVAVVTILILVLSLISVNTLIAVRAATNAAVAAVEQQVAVTVFFRADANPAVLEALKARLVSTPEVGTVEFVSREDVLNNFRARHAANTQIAESVDILGTNPFGAMLIIHSKDSRNYEKILTVVRDPAFAGAIQDRSFEDRDVIVARVALFTARAQQFAFGLAALFVCIAVLIVLNTIRVAIYSQREEIGIKKLVGATNGFIRAPFFVEGFMYVIISVGAVMGLTALAARFIDPLWGPLFSNNGFTLRSLFLDQGILFFGTEIILALLVVWGTVAVATRRYLRA